MLESQMHRYVAEVFYDLEACAAECGETLCAEGLADSICDYMHDQSAEYRDLPYGTRRAIAVAVAKQYV